MQRKSSRVMVFLARISDWLCGEASHLEVLDEV